MTQEQHSRTYDVVVAGGGVAGLSAALALVRSRRSVLVVDAGEPRNAPAAHSQGFLTRDGVPPQELRELGRAEVASYGGEVRAGRVVAGRALDGEGFALALDDGTEVRARRLLVASGTVDHLPDVKGVRERWGRDVVHCPYCHGWEVRDQPIGVIGSGPMAVHQTLLFRQLSDDVTLFQHTAPELTDQQREQLAALGVTVVPAEVAEVVVTDDAISGVRLETDEVVPVTAVAVGPRVEAGSPLLSALGLDAAEHPSGTGTHVPAGLGGLTAVPGVWVAGNVHEPSANLAMTVSAGFMAGAMINADLVSADAALAVAAR